MYLLYIHIYIYIYYITYYITYNTYINICIYTYIYTDIIYTYIIVYVCIYIYIYIYRIHGIYIKPDIMCSGAWVATKSWWWQPGGNIVFLFSWLHIYYAHLAFKRFEHSVCPGSLMTTYILLILFVLLIFFYPIRASSYTLAK